MQKSTNKTPFDSAPHCGMVTSYWNRFFQPVAAAFNFPMGKPPGRLWLRLPATWLWGRRTSLRLEIGRQYSDNGAYYNSKSPAAAATQATCTNIWYREDIHDVSSWKNVPLLFLVLKHSRTISAFWMVVGEGQENQWRKRRTRRLGKGRGELRSSERENLLLLRLACYQAPKAPDFHHVTFLLQEWWLAAK